MGKSELGVGRHLASSAHYEEIKTLKTQQTEATPGSLASVTDKPGLLSWEYDLEELGSEGELWVETLCYSGWGLRRRCCLPHLSPYVPGHVAVVEGRGCLSSAGGEFCFQGEGQNVGFPVCQTSASL